MLDELIELAYTSIAIVEDQDEDGNTYHNMDSHDLAYFIEAVIERYEQELEDERT